MLDQMLIPNIRYQKYQIPEISDMGEQTDLLPSLNSTMALIASRRSIMPKDLSGESLQKAEVKVTMKIIMTPIMPIMAMMMTIMPIMSMIG